MIFGFFKKETDSERQERERQELSIKALERGELPLRAQERIRKFKEDGKLFTSDLSCNELLLIAEAGYNPISQVMGSGFVNMAMWGSSTVNRVTGELRTRTDAHLKARELAVSRLKQEAHALGAHGVVGIKLEMKYYDWAARLVECTAIGTAIKIPGRPAPAQPFTSHLSGQEFWELYEGGHWPLTLAYGVSSYYVNTDYNTSMKMRNFWGGNNMANQELQQYTQSFNDAYNRAVSRLCAQAKEVDAEGIVGTTVNHNIEDVEYEINDTTYHDMVITVTALGTAIQQDSVARTKRTFEPLMIMDLKKGASTGRSALAQEQYAPNLSGSDE